MLQTAESSTHGRNTAAGYRNEDIILFEEGLIGFPGCKRFLLLENDELAPFRILRCVDREEVGFLVLDPRMIVKNYNRSIPADAWHALGVIRQEDRLSLAISIVGGVAEDSTANLQAPLLINYNKMVGRQLILTNSRYSVTQPLVPARHRTTQHQAAMAGRK